MQLLAIFLCLGMALGARVHLMEQEPRAEPPPLGNIVEELEKLGVTKLITLVKQAGLGEALQGPGPFTVLAPTDEAFTTIQPPTVIKELMANKTLLKNVLSYHVISGSVMSADLKNDMTSKTLWDGHDVRFNIYNRKHEGGMRVTAEGSPVVLADVKASNGVIHLIDRVMWPIPEGSALDFLTKGHYAMEFKTLTKLVTKLGLLPTLSGPGPFTIFAPSDMAFHRFQNDTLTALMKNETLLKNILEYHVVPATYFSNGFDDGGNITTINGKTLTTRLEEDMVAVNNAFIQSPDNAVTNGVVQVVSNLLIPPNVRLSCVLVET